MKDNYSNPLITIVIPTYNRWNFLQQAIASVMAQTYTNWELFVVDDGSTDETREAVAALNDKRIHLLSIKHCGNVALLRNKGAYEGTGDWIAFLDSDDLWLPGKLELQLRSLHQQAGSWGYSGYELMNDEGQTIPMQAVRYTTLSGWITKELLMNDACAIIGSLMVDRKLFEELKGFDTEPGLIFREDYELILRLSLKAEAVAVPGILTRLREHEGRSTHTIEDAHKRTAFMYDYFANYCPDKKLKRIAKKRQAYHEAEMAISSMKQKKYRKAMGQLSSAFRKGDKLRHILSSLRHGISSKTK